MTVEPGIALTLAAFGVGGIVWLVRLEGRIDKAEQRAQDHSNDITEIKSDMRYVRDRIDRALNGKHD
jgi:hypothetical protein